MPCIGSWKFKSKLEVGMKSGRHAVEDEIVPAAGGVGVPVSKLEGGYFVQSKGGEMFIRRPLSKVTSVTDELCLELE